MNIVEVTDVETLNLLIENYAITLEGLKEESFEDFALWVLQCGAKIENDNIYYAKGKTMNKLLNLNQNNFYPDDLNIVSIICSNIELVDLMKSNIDARWLKDIIKNSIFA